MKKLTTEVHLAREMSLMDATLIGVGAMIGAGIFVLIGIAAGVAGPALILAFLLNGVVALFTAMSYAELGSCYHDAGGGYLWVKEGLPKWNGFLSGWMSWFAHAVACSLYALGFGAYFEHLLRELGIAIPHWGFLSPQKTLAVGIAVLFAYINFRGASETGKIGNIVTLAKIVILAIFIGFGLEFILHKGVWKEPFTPFMANGWGGVFKAMGLTFIAFEGYEVIAQCSEEVKNPRKNIPRAVFLSLVIVLPLYLLVAVSALGSVNPGNLTPWDYLALHKETALVEVARNFFIGGGVLILIGGLISTMSALNATTYSSSRVAFAMGRDRNFPTFFSKVHSKNFSPHWAILASVAIVVLMAVSLPIEDVASAADIMFLLLFLQVNIAMIRLRKKRPDLDRGFTAPLYPWISILGIASLLFLALYMFSYSPIAWVVTALWLAAGLGVYYVYASRREIEHARKVRALERLEKREYIVLVCLSKPESAGSLASLAFAIAKKHEGRIIYLHVLEVGEGKPLRAGLEAAEHAHDLLGQAEDLAEESGIPARSIIKVAHRISQGILDTAVEEECNFIVMGRQQRPTFMDKFFSSLIDTVIEEAPSEVVILHGEITSEKIRTIMIPFSDNIHTRLATEIAPALAEYFQADLQIILILSPDAPEYLRKQNIRTLEEIMQQNAPSAKLKLVTERDVFRGILRNTRQADLILMGGYTGDFLQLLLGDSLAQDITENVESPVLWVKEYRERVPFWRTLFKSYSEEGEIP